MKSGARIRSRVSIAWVPHLAIRKQRHFNLWHARPCPSAPAEIDRLFADGRPTLTLIEGLGENVRYPLLQEALGSDSLTEVVTQLLYRNDAVTKLNAVVGANSEVPRLLQAGLGFAPLPRVM